MSPARALAEWVNRVDRRVARSRRLTRVAALMRNQCELIIAYHLAPTPNSSHNGERWLIEAMSPSIARFVDIGANVGDWTALVVMHNPTALGLAVEPAADALEQLRSRIAPTVRVIPAAAGDEEGVLAFYEQPEAGERSSAVSAWSDGGVPSQVSVVTVDALLEREGWTHIDVLKIDAEGYDARVIQGAERALSEHRIDVLQFEYNRPWRQAGSTLGGIMLFLQSLGYPLFVLRADGLELYDYARFGEFFSYSNFVAISPNSRFHKALGLA